MKRLNKKGIEASTMLVMLVVGAVIITISSMAIFKFKADVLENCEINNFHYLGDLPYKLSSMSGKRGYNDRESFSFSVPCGDRAYFVNLNKKNEMLSSKSLDSEPPIKDEVESDTGNNFFIMNGPKIVSATKLPGLSLDYPYNLCFDTKSSRAVKIEMEGRGGAGVNVIPYCEQLECTQVPEILQPNEKKKLIYTICGGTNEACANQCGKTYEDCYKACVPADAGCKNTCDTDADNCYKNTCALGDQTCYDTEKQNIENAEGNIEVRLRVSTCFPEKTKVEFLIKPKEGTAAKAVKIFETLPKKCVANLGDTLEKVEGGEGDVIINPDPMLVWPFDTLSKEERVAYHLSKFLSDDCRKELRAVAAAELIVNKPLIEAELRKDIEDIKIEEIKVAHLDEEFKDSLGDRNIELPAPQQTVFGLVRVDATTWELTPNPTVKTGKRMKTHRPRFESDQGERIKRGGRGSSIPDELSIVPESFEKIEEEVDEEDVVSTTGTDQVVIDLTNMKRLKDLTSGETLEFPGLPEGCAADPNNRIARITCSGGVDIDDVNINIVRTSPNGKVHERSFEVELKEEEKGAGGVNTGPKWKAEFKPSLVTFDRLITSVTSKEILINELGNSYVDGDNYKFEIKASSNSKVQCGVKDNNIDCGLTDTKLKGKIESTIRIDVIDKDNPSKFDSTSFVVKFDIK